MNAPKVTRKILTYPNPHLKEVAQRITDFDENVKSLFEEMCILMHQSDGVGLAATQIGEPIQLLVLSSYVFLSDEERTKILDEGGDMGKDIAVINPEVIEESKELIIGNEGCLSFPDVYIKVKRPSWVKIRAQDLNGEPLELYGEGLGARAILHEMDHLTGKVMTDHLSFLAKQKALKDHQRIQKIRQRETQQALEESGETPAKTVETSMSQKKESGRRNVHGSAQRSSKRGKAKAKKKRR